jgi:site-specific recombinase XerD
MERITHVNNLIEKITNPKHKSDAKEYIQERKSVDNVQPNTLACDMVSIYKLSQYLKNKPFQKATREDMKGFRDWMTQQGTQDTSRDLYLMKIKRFYKFIEDKELYKNGKADQRDIKYPDSVRWITYNQHDTDELPLESIIDDKQVKRLLDTCHNLRERVIIVSLLDGGLRVSELLALKNENVQFDPQLGAYFILPKSEKRSGKLKTGTRKVQLFLIPSSTAYIREYLNHHHMFKDDPKAPFIHSIDKRFRAKGVPATARGIDGIIQRITRESSLKVHLTPHILRHNSATRCVAKGFSEPMLRERFGWKKNSAMPSRYVHLVQKDIDNRIKEILGIKTEKTSEDTILQPIICSNCNYENVPTNVHCGRCGMKLNIAKQDLDMTASQLGVLLQKAENSNPEIKKYLDSIIREEVQKLLREQDKK